MRVPPGIQPRMTGKHPRVTDEFVVSYFSTKTYVVGTQKNRLHKTFLLSTQNIRLKIIGKKYLQFYTEIFCSSI